jgi:AcrR family transcriptional regulator
MPRGRPRSFDTDQALDTALDLFWRHGYEGTSLAALTSAIGVSAPSLYAAFGDKQSLFLKTVERYIQRPASYLAIACQKPTARAVAEQLFAGAIEMVMQRNHPVGCLLVQAALSTAPDASPVRDELTRIRHAAESHLRKRLERSLSDGDFPPTADPTLFARYLMTIVWGLSVQAAGGATRPQLQQVAHLALQALPT